MTDAAADADCASLHRHMMQHPLGGWEIFPLQWVHDQWLASVRERHCRWTFRRWVCNDVAPGICTEGEGSQRKGWLNQRVLTALQGIKDAKRVDDYPHIKFLESELRDLASRLSIPLYLLGHVTVPNLSPPQSAALHMVLRCMVQLCPVLAWEKQALHEAIRVVRSSPITVKRLFDSANREFDKHSSRPPCLCHTVDHTKGNVTCIEGHLALIPVKIHLRGKPLRPDDSIPMSGSKVRSRSLTDLQRIPHQIGASVPNLAGMLPLSLWPDSGSAVRSVQSQVTEISQSHYVRIVDKGVGMLWGFCEHWMWSVLEEFLRKEKYVPCSQSQQEISDAVKKLVQGNDWTVNPQGRMALLYLIGKAKSLVK